MRTLLASITVALALVASPLAQAADEAKPFATAKEIDLLQILPPPPANDSAQTKAELGEVLTLQVTRTPEMEKRAQADVVEDVWRFAEVIGSPKFNRESLPKFAAFFDRVVATEGAVVDPAKDTWKRPRPHQVSDLVKPTVKISNSGAWPSGHTTVGTLMGIVLSNMLPERRAAIMARAWEYGNNRIVGGIHYRSDVEMGRISGSVIAQTIAQQDDFKTEFAAAKAELRSALGM
ncbi:phosphatase PAP2 family protein [Terrarubrum flagellatum]|uniref:acid phosphatase n=1 Tax=Terrirubrum flagellatum TaxID=2895980 RepID=UPI003144DA3F